jgi:hypothetical protein
MMIMIWNMFRNSRKKIIYDNNKLPCIVMLIKPVNNRIYKYAVYHGLSTGSVKNRFVLGLNKQE